MKLNFSPADQLRWDSFYHDVIEKNERFKKLLADYLNQTPRLISANMVKKIAGECALPEKEAFRVLLAAAIGLDSATNAEDKELERQYLIPSLHRLEPRDWATDPYLTTIRFPTATNKNWNFATEYYAPYEPFVCNLPETTAQGREIPQLGYFTSRFRFPAVLEDGVEWMAVKPSEIATMRTPVQAACGHTVAFGLGLGYFAFHAARKAKVTKVTVVERNPNVIELFKTHLLPQFPNRDKVELICEDAFAYAAKKLPKAKADFAFVDLWHDQSDGLPLYLQMRRLESLSPGTRFAYWIEPLLLSSLRGMVLDRICDNGPGELTSFAEAQALLQTDYLRALAPKIQQIQ